ncbi:rhodanese-like domain-containing protein [Selenihalanaerobacter shriftii]|uniref:Rhodanese-related sulfurtransferase n=1 Tax=Selenihalanaerobacter shriftii TaxID=142842 RepID=A0A1T4LTY8_9FIRM|nr:rhodanese-like domain-containing protein [Selenihalanaerobacter shriftii]SJZ58076.1 Rhodanese-related sulfurtransferase [Selenihalanaerobacter shriftii]
MQNKFIIILLIALVVFVIFKSFSMTRNKGYESISVTEAKEMITKEKDVVVVDVRKPHEFNDGHISGAKSIPLSQLKDKYKSLDSNKKIIMVCTAGVRSARGSKLLVQQGFDKVYNLSGGMLAWNKL